ncbi:hypothetical protein [Kutzneria buriramensis]|uniref:Helix-turn-helix protein n=1 Tax=Kutzneria buriramensis TaxID=1045776 RepID=A0A3E0HEI3_9PSEU|nr:hypothetical protein [Kutzneria buriramensis]REH43607.1 hypothetical protein BCF44_109150 [Kutzneria buriramensis]
MDVNSQKPLTLAELIAPRRKALRLSQPRAADLAGVHRQTWITWEKGRVRPEEYNYAGIEQALQLPAGTVADVLAGLVTTAPDLPAPARAEVVRTRTRILSATPEELVALRQDVEEVMGREVADEFLRRALALREPPPPGGPGNQRRDRTVS